jgi:hypothetical protein
MTNFISPIVTTLRPRKSFRDFKFWRRGRSRQVTIPKGQKLITKPPTRLGQVMADAKAKGKAKSSFNLKKIREVKNPGGIKSISRKTEKDLIAKTRNRFKGEHASSHKKSSADALANQLGIKTTRQKMRLRFWKGRKTVNLSKGKRRSLARKKYMGDLRKKAKKGSEKQKKEAQDRLKAIATGDIKLGKSRFTKKYKRQAIKDYRQSMIKNRKRNAKQSMKSEIDKLKKDGTIKNKWQERAYRRKNKKAFKDLEKKRLSADITEMSVASKNRKAYKKLQTLKAKEQLGLISSPKEKNRLKLMKQKSKLKGDIGLARDKLRTSARIEAKRRMLKGKMSLSKRIRGKGKSEMAMRNELKKLRNEAKSATSTQGMRNIKAKESQAKEFMKKYQAQKHTANKLQKTTRRFGRNPKHVRQALKELRESRGKSIQTLKDGNIISASKGLKSDQAKIKSKMADIQGDKAISSEIKKKNIFKRSKLDKKQLRDLKAKRKATRQTDITSGKFRTNKEITNNATKFRKQTEDYNKLSQAQKGLKKRFGSRSDKLRRKRLAEVKAKIREGKTVNVDQELGSVQAPLVATPVTPPPPPQTLLESGA